MGLSMDHLKYGVLFYRAMKEEEDREAGSMEAM